MMPRAFHHIFSAEVIFRSRGSDYSTSFCARETEKDEKYLWGSKGISLPSRTRESVHCTIEESDHGVTIAAVKVKLLRRP